MRLPAAGRPVIGRITLVQTVEALLLTLRQRNQTELQEQLGETALELQQVRQPTVSQTLQPLIEVGAVEALPRRGRKAIRYLMTSTARLAL
jgi:DNA-binding transcriptional ArsR family regulator